MLLLEPVSAPQPTFQAVLGHQSPEDAAINGTAGKIEVVEAERYPFIVMLDGIVSLSSF